jgi:hypothetical protein
MFAVTLALGGVADAFEIPGAEVATSESKVFSQESINLIHRLQANCVLAYVLGAGFDHEVAGCYNI